MIPGELLIEDGEIALNEGRRTVTLTVTNTGDRPIQVGSHYHFFETNPALAFDRQAARGMRLDIPAGTAVRFEPGQSRSVMLVAFAGTRRVYGFRQQVMGALDAPARSRSKTKNPKKTARAEAKSGQQKIVRPKTAAGRPKPARRAPNLTPKR